MSATETSTGLVLVETFASLKFARQISEVGLYRFLLLQNRHTVHPVHKSRLSSNYSAWLTETVQKTNIHHSLDGWDPVKNKQTSKSFPHDNTWRGILAVYKVAFPIMMQRSKISNCVDSSFKQR